MNISKKNSAEIFFENKHQHQDRAHHEQVNYHQIGHCRNDSHFSKNSYHSSHSHSNQNQSHQHIKQTKTETAKKKLLIVCCV